MRQRLTALLAVAAFACGGGDSNGPGNVDVLGPWIVTFTSGTNVSCQLSQIAFIITQSNTGAETGTHGSYAISCPGQQDVQRLQGTITSWAVSGDRFSIDVAPLQTLSGTVSGATYTGSFTWVDGPSITGTFVAVKQ